MAYDPTTPAGQVRLLINDTSGSPVFDDNEIAAFLSLEGQSVRLAAAQALDTIADDEALTSKILSVNGLSTNGAGTAASLRQRATALRQQAYTTDDDGFYFEIIPPLIDTEPVD